MISGKSYRETRALRVLKHQSLTGCRSPNRLDASQYEEGLYLVSVGTFKNSRTLTHQVLVRIDSLLTVESTENRHKH